MFYLYYWVAQSPVLWIPFLALGVVVGAFALRTDIRNRRGYSSR